MKISDQRHLLALVLSGLKGLVGAMCEEPHCLKPIPGTNKCQREHQLHLFDQNIQAVLQLFMAPGFSFSVSLEDAPRLRAVELFNASTDSVLHVAKMS